MLTFDEAAHRYAWNGRPVPNVTTILQDGGLIDLSMVPLDVLERTRQEGKAIHKMVELECKGAAYNVPEWLEPYRRAWHRFAEESGFELWASEHRMYNEAYGYAGTLDLVGIPKRFKDPAASIIDVKRSFASGAAIGVQESAYQESWNRGNKLLIARRRYGLKLMPNGEYRCQKFEEKDDFGTFLAALQLYRWKEKHL